MVVSEYTYGTVAGLERLIGDIVESREFTETTVPSLAQVEAELDNAAADLNRELDQVGYTVPVVEADYPVAYNFLKAANAYGAAAVLLSTVPSEGYDPTEEVEGAATDRATTLGNKFKSALKAIREHRLRAAMRKDRLDDMFAGSAEDEDGNEKKPIFTRGMDDYPGRRSLVENGES